MVTGFGEQGAIRHDQKPKAGPLVIPKLDNRDWRSSRQNLLPPEVQAQRNSGENEKGKAETDVMGEASEDVKWGLSVRRKEVVEVHESGDDVTVEARSEETREPKPKSADEEALQALTNGSGKKGPDLVIPSSLHSEDDLYRKAVAEAPDVSTLEDYERVPVEEFGAALLRGMGWDGKLEEGSKVKEVKRRQNLLGLGAKETGKEEEGLGAWVGKSDVKRLKANKQGGFDKERRPKLSDYRREKERRDERREERGGATSYRRERERERERDHRNGYRDRDGYRERDRDGYRDSHRDRDRDRRR